MLTRLCRHSTSRSGFTRRVIAAGCPQQSITMSQVANASTNETERRSVREVVEMCNDVDHQSGDILPILLREESLVAHIGWISSSSASLAYLLSTFSGAVSAAENATGSSGASPITVEVTNQSPVGLSAVAIKFAGAQLTPVQRTANFKTIADCLREAGLVRGWRDELYAVKPFSLLAVDETDSTDGLGAIERAVTTILGIPQFGVHALIYQNDGADADEKNIWIAQRSATKATWPSCWDSTVAGGLGYQENVDECMARECQEEASLPEEVAKPLLRRRSMISFGCVFDGQGLFFDNDFVYDVKAPKDFKPVPEDGEVGCFEFVSANELLSRIQQPKKFPFLPSALLSCVDFLIRHKYIDAGDLPPLLRFQPPKLDLSKYFAKDETAQIIKEVNEQ